MLSSLVVVVLRRRRRLCRRRRRRFSAAYHEIATLAMIFDSVEVKVSHARYAIRRVLSTPALRCRGAFSARSFDRR